MESDRAGVEGTASGALRQLEQLVRALGEELATFRRRAHAAEARVRALEGTVAAGGDLASMERLQALEAENAELKTRIAYATARTRQLATRMKFVRQQAARAGQPGGGTA